MPLPSERFRGASSGPVFPDVARLSHDQIGGYGAIVTTLEAAAPALVGLLFGVAAAALVIDHDVIVNNFGRGCAWAVLGAAIGPQFILALMGKRASYAGTVAGMAVGCVVAIGW